MGACMAAVALTPSKDTVHFPCFNFEVTETAIEGSEAPRSASNTPSNDTAKACVVALCNLVYSHWSCRPLGPQGYMGVTESA